MTPESRTSGGVSARPESGLSAGGRAVVLAAIAMLGLLAVSCSSSSSRKPAGAETTVASTRHPGTNPDDPTPGTAWKRVSPASVGLDAAALERSAKTAEVGKSECLVVVRDGAIAGEWNFDGFDPDTMRSVFSVTKSITSILVGIAQDDGDLSLDDHAAKWIPQWRDTPAAAVTVRDLLSMDSGRAWSLASDYTQLIKAKDQTAFATGLSQAHSPGQQWAYNNSAVQTLEQVLEKATGMPVTEYAERRLFGPVGMTRTQMGVDGAGNTKMYEGAQSTCEDLARFGQLLLDKGRWGTKQVVSAGYVAEATARSSTKLNVGYGYLFWLNHRGHIGNPQVATDLDALSAPTTKVGRLAPGAPVDMFWAIGLGNQLVQVDPGSKTVVVRLGEGGARPEPPTFGPTEASKVVTQAVK